MVKGEVRESDGWERGMFFLVGEASNLDFFKEEIIWELLRVNPSD